MKTKHLKDLIIEDKDDGTLVKSTATLFYPEIETAPYLKISTKHIVIANKGDILKQEFYIINKESAKLIAEEILKNL